MFRFFETFCEHASCNKLCRSTNFVIFGPTNQKLWVFENFRRNLGKAGMVVANEVELIKVSKSGGIKRQKRGGSKEKMGTHAWPVGDQWSPADCGP
jgi:hypothetical protein